MSGRVEVEDLLGREPVEVDVDAIASYVKDKTVLVTGAGGSIGSELCRQLARAERSGSSCSTRPRAHSSRSSASSSTSAASAPAFPSSPTCDDRRPRGLRALPARRRLPCRRVQARAADGGESARVGGEQRRRDEERRRRGDRARRRALRPDLDRQGAQPLQRLRPDEDACEWIVGSHGERDDVPTSSSPSASATCSTRPAA